MKLSTMNSESVAPDPLLPDLHVVAVYSTPVAASVTSLLYFSEMSYAYDSPAQTS